MGARLDDYVDPDYRDERIADKREAAHDHQIEAEREALAARREDNGLDQLDADTDAGAYDTNDETELGA